MSHFHGACVACLVQNLCAVLRSAATKSFVSCALAQVFAGVSSVCPVLPSTQCFAMPQKRARCLADAARGCEDIRIALQRGSEQSRAKPGPLNLAAAQEEALAEWPRALVELAAQAWEDTTADSSPLLVLANANLLPEAVLLAFHLPTTAPASPDEVKACQDIVRIASSWWKLQHESMQKVRVLASNADSATESLRL
eukprot:s3998_g6.t1